MSMKTVQMKCVIPLLILSSFLRLHADETLNEFESILNEANEIATQKSINVDYMPSVVTVVDAQTFLDAGMQNVGEALGMLPGIQMQIGYLGQPITTIRGFKNPNSFISDKIKVLVDGVAINNEAAGTSGFYMDFPLDLIDRIEVLRGPGSTVYGAGAIYGSVNIITKTQSITQSMYAGIGSYDSKNIGGNFHATLGEFKVDTDAYYFKNDKELEDDGEFTDEAKEDLSVGVKIAKGGFEFLSRYKSSKYGNFYARKGDLVPNNDRGRKDDYFLSQLSYAQDINGYILDTKLRYSYRESDISAYVDTNVNKYANLFSLVAADMQDAFYIRDHQAEQNFEAEASLKIPKIYSNSINIGLGIRKVNLSANDMFSSIENAIAQNLAAITSDADIYAIFKNATKQPLYWEDPTNTKIFGETTRTITHLNIQDLISLNEKTDLILGARVDNYSDIGAHLSSRAGLVYRADDSLIFKLLYGSAFRAPTFTEKYTDAHIFYRYGDRDLKEETVDTYEAALIYMPDRYNKIILNIYYSTLNNVIDLEELTSTDEGYQNMKNRSSKGVELEYFFNTKEKHNLYFNASYVEADYTTAEDNESPVEIDQSMPDISKYMLKAMYIFKPIKNLSFGTSWQYYSQTTKTKLLWAVEAGRDVPVDAQSIFDETVTYKFSENSQLRFTIKNLFDTEVKLPSYYYRQDGGVLREGRNFALNYKYLF